MTFYRGLVAALMLASLALAQDRDFLTASEVDQVREAQEPNERLQLYLRFARQRLDMAQSILAKDKPGRSVFVHDTLEDYSRIIEAIDSVSDDALKHKANIEKGLVAVANAEKEFLDQLNKIQSSAPKDLPRYKFALDDALETTSSSLELAREDTAARSGELAAADAKERKERESMTSKKEVNERKKAAEEEQEKQKKVPSLYRPGEKPQQPQ